MLVAWRFHHARDAVPRAPGGSRASQSLQVWFGACGPNAATGMVPWHVPPQALRNGLACHAWCMGRPGRGRMVPSRGACYAGRRDVTRPTTFRKVKLKPKAKPVPRPVLSRDTNASESNIPENDLLRRLALIAGDEKASSTSRVSALRTALEVSGALGRHARKPQDTELSLSPGVLTRAGLERELMRLRRVVMPGTEG
jgi:hypothetical protein